VTVHIKALEDELGVPLFERCRSSKTVILTDVGRQVLEYAGRLLALAEETKARSSSVGQLVFKRAPRAHVILHRDFQCWHGCDPYPSIFALLSAE
jgi:DNA-binding transcriptional LysR family regulator